MLCEICGEREATTRIELDGVILRVCSKCAKFGREIEEKKTRISAKRIKEEIEEDILPDYSEKVRKARERKGISRKELAMMINEKESVIEKIETGKMLPDEKLTKKLEKTLNIKLKGTVDFGKVEHKEVEELTLGDIAEVRVKQAGQ